MVLEFSNTWPALLAMMRYDRVFSNRMYERWMVEMLNRWKLYYFSMNKRYTVKIKINEYKEFHDLLILDLACHHCIELHFLVVGDYTFPRQDSS